MPRSEALPPPLASGDTPPLLRLPGLKFQEMCRDLFDREPEVRQCEEYGKNGQAQRGIDLLGHRNDGRLEVAQCKCERDFTPAKIRTASTEFLDHWEFWKQKNVTRFVVFVASEASQTQRQDEILRQKNRFQKFGIVYELWPANKIVNQLRPYPGIVSTHLGPTWASYLCGSADDLEIRAQLAGLSALNDRLISAVADVTDNRILQVKDMWQRGRRTDARNLLHKMKDDRTIWITFPKEMQASVLRLEASLCLESDCDINSAESLISEATRLAPNQEDNCVRASILWSGGKHAEAIQELATSNAPRARTQLAVMLAALGRAVEAEAELAKLQEQTAERLRVEALINLCAKRMPEARTAILKAREQAPNNVNIKYAEAIINFWSVVTSVAVPNSLVAWPEPIRWSFILRDDESNRRIEKSAESFREALSETELNEQERQLLETWYIAALANNPNKQDFAECEICRLLSADPNNHRLLVWAVARFPQRKFPTSVHAARSALINGLEDPEKAITLAYYYVANRKPKKASKLLAKTKLLFERAGAATIWTGLMAQVTAMTDGVARAREVLQFGQIPEAEARRIEASVLRLEDELQSRLPIHLKESYQVTGDSRFLLDLVEWQVEHGKWSDAVQWCERLVAEINSAEVIWLAVVVSYRAQRADLCLQFLNEGQGLFPNLRLPSELRRIRIDTQRQLGFVPVAIQEAEHLAHEEPSLDNLLALSELYFSIGDQRRTCIVSERVLELDVNAPATVYLRLAWQSQWENAQLAIQLWKRAVKVGLADSDIPPALNLGHNLGLEDELNDLTRRMMTLGAKGMEGVQLATLDDLKQYAQAFRDNAQNIIMHYERGGTPVHAVAQQLNLTLADIFHEYPAESQKATFGWTAPAVLSRNGRRSVSAETGTSSWIVRVDATSLLLAQHFNYLGRIEQAFPPLQISPNLIPSLVAMQDHLTASQPSRIEGFRAILQAYSQGELFAITEDQNTVSSNLPDTLLGDWATLYQAAKGSDGYVVDFIPIVTESGPIPLSELPSEAQRIVIGQKAVLRSMSESGPLSQREYMAFLERLGSITAEPDNLLPVPGSSLYFHGTCIETFASVGLLSSICGHFRVFVERSELDRLEEELREFDRRLKLAIWIKGLVERLSAGIRSGIYTVLPVAAPSSMDEVPNDSAKLDVSAMQQLLTARATENHRLWCDDRWINGHQRAGSMEIIDSVSILQALRQSGRVLPSEFYDIIGRMRSEGICFIPLTADEVLASLTDAHVRDSKLVETSRLKNLRRGLGMSFLRSNLLQHGNSNAQGGDPGELAFLIQSMRACVDALKDLWTVAQSETELLARARWILESLHVDFAALRRIAGLPSTEADDLYVSAIEVAGMLSRAISIRGKEHDRETAKKYIKWVFNTFVTPRLYFEPEFMAKVGLAVRRVLLDTFPKALDDPLSRASAALLGSLVMDLPPILQSQIAFDVDFAVQIGLKLTPVASVGELRFGYTEYISAAREAINGGRAVIRTLDQKIEMRFTSSGTRPNAIEMHHSSLGKNILVEDSALGLLSESIERREMVAKHFARQLDVPPGEFKASVADLVSTEEPVTRLQKAEALRSKSLPFFIFNLKDRIRRREELKDSDLLPNSPEAFPRFLRTAPDHSLNSGQWLELYADIAGRDSILPALDRICSLPIELPVEIESQIFALPPDAQRDLIRSLFRQTQTPVCAIHFARILAVLGIRNERYRRLVNRVVTQLVRSMDSEIRAYLTVVRWAVSKLSMWRGTESWSPSFRLASAWVLGDQIFAAFRAEGIDPQWLLETFSVTPSIAENIFADSFVKHDVADPTNVEPEVFVACSLAYIFQGESAICIGGKLQSAVKSFLLFHSGTHSVPMLPLLPNPAMATNLLESFLGRDRIAALLNTVELDTRNALQQAFQETPQEQAKLALESLGLQGWITLGAAVGGFPPPPDLIPFIETAIEKTEFQEAVEREPHLAALALCIATRLLLFTTKEELILRCKTQLCQVAKQMNRSRMADTATSIPILLECVLNISRTRPAILNRIGDFSILTAQIAIEWPKFGEDARPTIQRLCQELPITQTPELWRLVLRLRTR